MKLFVPAADLRRVDDENKRFKTFRLGKVLLLSDGLNSNQLVTGCCCCREIILPSENLSNIEENCHNFLDLPGKKDQERFLININVEHTNFRNAFHDQNALTGKRAAKKLRKDKIEEILGYKTLPKKSTTAAIMEEIYPNSGQCWHWLDSVKSELPGGQGFIEVLW